MVQPTNGQTVQDLAKHVDQGVFWSVIGWVIGGLAALAATLFGWDRGNTKRSVTALFKWKDETVDPALKELPHTYVTKHDLEVYVYQPNARDHERIMEELGAQRGMLEELLKRK
jgi:hypothetical protein